MTGKKTPRDGIEAKFSIYYGAACGLLFGKATPAEYEDEVVVQTAELRKKIEACTDITKTELFVIPSSGIMQQSNNAALYCLYNPTDFQSVIIDKVQTPS